MRAPRPPVPAPMLALALLAAAAAAAAAHAETAVPLSVGGCQHGGRWYRAGAAVPGVGDACLRCACGGGALACSRRACAPLPAPAPPRCHVRHRKNHCCPELHCPDSVTTMERGASARLDNDDLFAVAAPHPLLHACVEDGVVFQSGSALHSAVACEQCFCLRGARRCVRPRCLPPPPGCRAPRAPGACCPQRYYCDHHTNAAATPADTHPLTNNTRDCLVDGVWVAEGERVRGAEARRPCSTCFCLRGSARCRPLACARALLGCTPLLHAGECCPHKYTCPHGSTKLESKTDSSNDILHNSLAYSGGEDRSIYGKTSREETPYDSTTSTAPRRAAPADPTPPAPPAPAGALNTSKVKRKTSEAPPTAASPKHLDNNKFTKLRESTTTDDFTFSTTEIDSTTVTGTESEETSLDEINSYVKTVINGTINCTTEFASSQPLNLSLEELARIAAESMPRAPPAPPAERAGSDVITAAQLYDNDTFTINVTSSLHANPAPPRTHTGPSPRPGHDAHNDSKTNDDYDYDYAEPTLPPSLPNLKIIPFVAADAVVDDEPLPKENPTYQILEREDKFPVYYPKVETEAPLASRRQDVHEPQYPMYAADTSKGSEDEVPGVSYAGLPGAGALAASLHQYALDQSNTNQLELQAAKDPPSVNMFSPPVETEGGFVPKGPSIINEYYAGYLSTPSAPHVLHLTTSMQLDTNRDECISSDGRRVPEGETIVIACSECACAWGELHCSPRPCVPAPPGCRRRPTAIPASAVTALVSDQCCGEIVCPKANKTTSITSTTTTKTTMTTTITSKPSTSPQRVSSSTEGTKIKYTEKTKTVPTTSTSLPATTPDTFKMKTDSLIDSNQETVNHTTFADAEVTSTQKSPIPVHQNKAITTTIRPPLHSTPAPTAVVTTTEVPFQEEVDDSQQKQGSQEYEEEEEEEEEEEDEGFSFGSVLKLLLSDSYDSTPAPSRRPPPAQPTTPPATAAAAEQYITSTPASTSTSTMTTVQPPSTTAPLPISTTIRPPSTSYRAPTSTTVRVRSTSYRPPTTRRPLTRTTVAPFVPMPPQNQHHAPPKGFIPPTSVNRIDHLVLGEATAIKRTTSRPVPLPTFRPYPLRPAAASRPASTTRRPLTTRAPEPLGGVGVVGGAGLLKLAGCNIYGRMYSVGLVVAELAAPCRECRCTEVGVQCRDLPC